MSSIGNKRAAGSAPAGEKRSRAQAWMVICAAFTGAACAELLATDQADEAMAACEGNAQALALYLKAAEQLEQRVRAGDSLMAAVETMVQEGWPAKLGVAVCAGLH